MELHQHITTTYSRSSTSLAAGSSISDMARVRRMTTAGTIALSRTRASLALAGAGITTPWPAIRSDTSGTCSRTCSQQPRYMGKLTLSSAAANPSDTTNPEQEALSLSDSVQRLRELLDDAGGAALALTGAGMSTDSGIPDYRGPRGSYSRGHKPMMHNEFLSSEANRKRYWARSTFGWSAFSKARPNAAHVALAALEAAGKVGGVITQNVDGLHQKAGSRNVVDLHGRNDKVECMSCQSTSSRDAYQTHLAQINAAWINKHSPEPTPGEAPSGGDPSVELTPDGDANVEPGEYLGGFVVPACVKCGGVLKPTVVFFGDNIPRPRVEETYRMVDESNLIVVAGSSLQVHSAFRLVKRAADAGKTVVVVNLGDTRAERSGLDVLKVEGGVSRVLPLLL